MTMALLAMAFHHFPEEHQCSGLVTGLNGEGFECLAFVIDSPPQMMLLTVDFHKHLVEMPAPVGIRPHAVDPFPSDLSGEHRPEAVPPEPHGLVAGHCQTNVARRALRR